jgi:hypothetical protein
MEATFLPVVILSHHYLPYRYIAFSALEASRTERRSLGESARRHFATQAETLQAQHTGSIWRQVILVVAAVGESSCERCIGRGEGVVRSHDRFPR